MAVVYLVRHGQASFGALDYDQLSELGVRQATLTGAALRARGRAIDVVVRGTMVRHRQTAEAALANATEPPGGQIVVDGGWDEYDHDAMLTAYEPRFADRAQLGLELAAAKEPRARFQELFAAAVARWVSGAHDGDYVESWTAFAARVERALQTLAERMRASGAQTALVCTSGGPIAALAGRLMSVRHDARMALAWTLANCGVSKLLVNAGGVVRLSTLNEHAHLEAQTPPCVTYR